MVRRELGVYNYSIPFEVLQNNLFTAVEADFSVISVPASYASLLRDYKGTISVAGVVDWPYGIGSPDVRAHATISAINAGVDIVEALVNTRLLEQKNWTELRKDTKRIIEICNLKNVVCRFVIDYRTVSKEDLFELCDLLAECGVETIITASGSFMDDPVDTIIVSNQLASRYKDLVIVPASNRWRRGDLEKLKRFDTRIIVSNYLGAVYENLVER